MFTIAPASATPATLTLPPSLAVTPATDLVSTRLTTVALPAPLSNSQLTDNAQPNTTQQAVTESADNTGRPSSPFLAQLISQEEESGQDGQIGLSTSFARFAPAPTYNTLIGYSIVKYRPSNAGLPSPYVSASKLKTESGISASRLSQAYDATKSRNDAKDTVSQHVAIAG